LGKDLSNRESLSTNKMIKTLENRKKQLIEQIEQLDNEAFIQEIENKLLQFQQLKSWQAIKPIQKNITIEAMIAQQNYQPPTKSAFFEKTAELAIEESLEDLLSMLKK
jgi:hypothetical protein